MENGVRQAERAVLGGLRDRQFFSLAELDAANAEIVTAINTELFQKRNGSHSSTFEDEERGACQALPVWCYEYTEWKAPTTRSPLIACHRNGGFP